jgi:uncharacterized membrane protein (DUF485 family)
MTDEATVLKDPAFQRLLKRRSHWRWGLSGGLIGAYLAYCLAGVYLPDVLARPVLGSSIPWGIALGYLIIALSVFLSILYIRIVGRILEVPLGDRESKR